MFPQSADIANAQSYIKQNRDIRNGKDAMYINRETYFRRLSGQEDSDYDTMIDMAPMYTLYPKVVDGFVGTIFRKPTQLQGADEFSESNVDLLGNSLQEYCQEVTRYVFEDGFCATMVDWSAQTNSSFYRLIQPEQFISYLTDNSRGYPALSRFIYKETVEEQSESEEFATDDYGYHTVLDFEDGIVRVRRYKNTDEDEHVLVSTTYPKRNGKALNELPVVIHGIKPNNFSITKSPLQDISDLNITLDQRVIDLIYLLHWSALPTPYATGVDPTDPDAPKSIGPTKAWLISAPDAKVGMLEFSGQAYEAHLSYLDHLMYIMSAIGAQILKKEGVSRETASSVLIRTGAQTSLIATIVDNISSQMEKLIKMKLDWENIPYSDELEFTLNRDFIQVDLEPNAQIALVKSWMDGAISFDSMFHKMKEGEIIPSTRTKEDELRLIKENPPPFFKEKVQSDLGSKAMNGGADNQPAKDDTSGSNLETGNGVSNPLATETA